MKQNLTFIPRVGLALLMLFSPIVRGKEELVHKPGSVLEVTAIYDCLRFGNMAYQINFDNRFQAEDQIEFVFLVFGTGVDTQTQKPSLKVNYIIKQEGTPISQFPLQY